VCKKRRPDCECPIHGAEHHDYCDAQKDIEKRDSEKYFRCLTCGHLSSLPAREVELNYKITRAKAAGLEYKDSVSGGCWGCFNGHSPNVHFPQGGFSSYADYTRRSEEVERQYYIDLSEEKIFSALVKRVDKFSFVEIKNLHLRSLEEIIKKGGGKNEKNI
jgi:hypothetical protein